MQLLGEFISSVEKQNIGGKEINVRKNGHPVGLPVFLVHLQEPVSMSTGIAKFNSFSFDIKSFGDITQNHYDHISKLVG